MVLKMQLTFSLKLTHISVKDAFVVVLPEAAVLWCLNNVEPNKLSHFLFKSLSFLCSTIDDLSSDWLRLEVW